jgi:hypothetical protein
MGSLTSSAYSARCHCSARVGEDREVAASSTDLLQILGKQYSAVRQCNLLYAFGAMCQELLLHR